MSRGHIPGLSAPDGGSAGTCEGGSNEKVCVGALRTIEFLSTLADGTYGLSDLAAFDLQVELKLKPTGSPPGFFVTADYVFGLNDLSDFQITYVGGVAKAASWTLDPVAYSQTTGGIAPPPISVDFVSGAGLSFYSWTNGEKTLIANSDGLQATFLQTAAVPEPATWALMLLGFAGVGLMMRRGTSRQALPI
jgi:hypothetical protein